MMWKSRKNGKIVNNPIYYLIINKFKDNYPFGTFRKLPIRTHAWMDGGIILRNIKDWKGLFPAGLRKLFGTGEDRLCLTVRHRISLDIYLYYSNQVKHWEHHNPSFVPGR